jgi:hypothetical protein
MSIPTPIIDSRRLTYRRSRDTRKKAYFGYSDPNFVDGKVVSPENTSAVEPPTTSKKHSDIGWSVVNLTRRKYIPVLSMRYWDLKSQTAMVVLSATSTSILI